MPLPLLFLIVLLPALGRTQTGDQFGMCRSLRGSEAGPGWEFYACQPPPANMKEVMQIRVDPPGITCGNPPERFCTLVSHTHLNTETHTPENRDTHLKTETHLKIETHLKTEHRDTPEDRHMVTPQRLSAFFPLDILKRGVH